MNLNAKDSLLDLWNKFVGDGSQQALEKIYFHYYDRLFTYGLKHTPDKQLVEDSIQTIFLNFIQKRKGIGSVKNLTGYLMSTLRHQLFYNLAKQKKTILTDELPDEKFDFFNNENSDEYVSDEEQIEQVRKAVKESIGKLPSRQQEIFFLRFDSGISYEEIAEIFGITVDSCYKSVYRSIRAVREEVERTMGKGNILFWVFLLFFEKGE